MANTYVKIGSTVTVGVLGATDITFSSIPSTYTDLLVVASVRGSDTLATNTNLRIQFNGSTSNYSERQLYGNGSSATSATLTYASLGYVSSAGATASTFGNCQAYIPNYASSAFKSISAEGVAEGNTTAMLMAIDAGLWSDTSAITSIKLFVPSYNLVQYSTATLYGISKS
jgi:hypothetical protein